MSVGIRVKFEAAGHPVQIEREKNGFAMDLVGDGGVFIPAASLAEALAFLDEVRTGLEESERMFVAMMGGPATEALALTGPTTHVESTTEQEGTARQRVKRATNGSGKGKVTDEQKASIRGSLDRTAREVAGELDLPESAVSYYMARYRAEGRLSTEAEPAGVEGFRANGNGHDSE